jgi:PRC-barrel domain
MLKSHMAACLVATALAAAPAFAQTGTAPSGATDRPAATGSGSATSGSSAMQPSTGATVGTNPAGSGGSAAGGSGSMSQTGSGTSGASGSSAAGQSESPSTTSGSASTAGAGASGASAAGSGSSVGMASATGGTSGQIVSQQQPGQWMASKLIGTTVTGPNNESIGDVNDVLLDRNGQAVAVIVGVGGFLGIGEKDVAVSFNQLEFTSRADAARATGSTGSANQGSGSSTTVATGSTTASGVPDRIMIRMSKQDLQNAPRFARADQQRDTTATGTTAGGSRPASGGDRGTTGTAPGSPGGSSQAPRQ